MSSESNAHRRCLTEFIALLLIGLVVHAGDAVLTYMGMESFGTSAEGNPLARAVMEEYGVLFGVTCFKAVATLLVSLVLCALLFLWRRVLGPIKGTVAANLLQYYLLGAGMYALWGWINVLWGLDLLWLGLVPCTLLGVSGAICFAIPRSPGRLLAHVLLRTAVCCAGYVYIIAAASLM